MGWAPVCMSELKQSLYHPDQKGHILQSHIRNPVMFRWHKLQFRWFTRIKREKDAPNGVYIYIYMYVCILEEPVPFPAVPRVFPAIGPRKKHDCRTRRIIWTHLGKRTCAYPYFFPI